MIGAQILTRISLRSASAEAHLFLVMIMVLLSKTDLAGERYGMLLYDIVATVLFVIFVPMCAIGCIVSKWCVASVPECAPQ